MCASHPCNHLCGSTSVYLLLCGVGFLWTKFQIPCVKASMAFFHHCDINKNIKINIISLVLRYVSSIDFLHLSWINFDSSKLYHFSNYCFTVKVYSCCLKFLYNYECIDLSWKFLFNVLCSLRKYDGDHAGKWWVIGEKTME